MIELKHYQTQTLEALKAYLEAARFKGAKAAFDAFNKEGVPSWKAYQPMEGLPETPFVCLRLPTGGGKTLLAAHTVKIATEAYLEREFPLVLWLMPTKTIREQTLETLRKPGNPNHETLRKAFDGRVTVIDIADFAQLRPHDLKSRACIVVGTIQTLKVKSSEGRKVYAHNENLEAHFAGVPDHIEGLDRNDDGKIRYSFRNLLAVHRPLVIVDEAHNAGTELSDVMMRRIRARCIVEFTATPAPDSNVLHNVSATALKAEEMIKLPIRLKEHGNWEEAVHDAILTRQRLAELAAKDSAYIRPIVLYQAEKRNQDVTKDVLLKHLTDVENIKREKIAVVTGDQKELDGINLFDRACPIEHVITIEALKEGWDCSFAYVFCSVANVHSKKDVEQILGRVLRMPYAKRRSDDELNRAYAHVARSGWPHAVSQLHDRLVDMGFDDREANGFIERPPEIELPGGGMTPKAVPVLPVSVPADFSLTALPESERASVSVEQGEAGNRVIFNKPVSEAALKAIEATLPDAGTRKEFRAEHRVFEQTWLQAASPFMRGVPFKAPALCVMQQGELTLAEAEVFLDANGWDLLDGKLYPPELSEAQFNLRERGHEYEIDINAGHLQQKIVGTVEQFVLDLIDTGWTEGQLCRWLDGRLRQPDINQPVLLEFIRRSIASLIETRGIPLTTLVRHRYVLEKVLQERLKEHRRTALAHGFQQTLFGAGAAVEVSFDFGFDFARPYPTNWTYNGSYQFKKHFHFSIGELKDKGEEFDCAKAIDMLPQVRHWIRNLSQSPDAFWLPTATDRFYPDFVVELMDGRILVVEHKGAHYISNDDSKEKRNIGELWAARSNKKGSFVMTVVEPGKPPLQNQIEAAIGK